MTCALWYAFVHRKWWTLHRRTPSDTFLHSQCENCPLMKPLVGWICISNCHIPFQELFSFCVHNGKQPGTLNKGKRIIQKSLIGLSFSLSQSLSLSLNLTVPTPNPRIERTYDKILLYTFVNRTVTGLVGPLTPRNSFRNHVGSSKKCKRGCFGTKGMLAHMYDKMSGASRTNFWIHIYTPGQNCGASEKTS